MCMFGKRHWGFESLSHYILSHIFAVRKHRSKDLRGVSEIHHCGGLSIETLHVHEPFLLTNVTCTTRTNGLRFETVRIRVFIFVSAPHPKRKRLR